MFNKVELIGQIDTSEEVTRGEFSEVSLECEGSKITLRGKILEIIKSLGVSQAVGIRVDTPDGQSTFVSSLDSPALTDNDGKDIPAPAGATYTPVYQGQAA